VLCVIVEGVGIVVDEVAEGAIVRSWQAEVCFNFKI
jgi:hypothetical protein